MRNTLKKTSSKPKTRKSKDSEKIKEEKTELKKGKVNMSMIEQKRKKEKSERVREKKAPTYRGFFFLKTEHTQHHQIHKKQRGERCLYLMCLKS